MFHLPLGSRGFSLLATLAVVGLLPGIAAADGLAIYKQEILSGKAGPAQQVFNDPAFFGRAINAAWAAARPELERQLKSELGKSNRFGRGFTLYDIVLNFARSGPVQVQAHGANAVLLTYTLNGNYLRVTSTVPGPTPKSWDPTIHVNFNLQLRMVVTLPRPGTAARVTWISANLTRVEARSKSVLVAIAKFFVDSFVKGGTRGLLERGINLANSKLSAKVNVSLGSPDRILTALRPAGFTGYKAEVLGGRVVLTLTRTTSIRDSIFRPVPKGGLPGPGGVLQRPTGSSSPGGNVALNPQPLPPRVLTTPGGNVALNPQPLPPRVPILR